MAHLPSLLCPASRSRRGGGTHHHRHHNGDAARAAYRHDSDTHLSSRCDGTNHRSRSTAVQRAKAKLRCTAGETISEVLVGVLIVGLATVMFATMVSVAVSTSLDSSQRTTATYQQISVVDGKTGARTGTGLVTLAGTSSMGGNSLNTSFKVETASSSIDAEGTAAYSFTRYAIPANLQTRGAQ